MDDTMESKYAIVTLETKHIGYDEERVSPLYRYTRTIHLFGDHLSMEKFEEGLQGRCDDVYNYKTLWKGHVDDCLDRPLVNSLKSRLDNDAHSETANEVLNAILELPGILDAVMSTIPKDWEYRTAIHGGDATKEKMAFHYIWEKLQEERT